MYICFMKTKAAFIPFGRNWIKVRWSEVSLIEVWTRSGNYKLSSTVRLASEVSNEELSLKICETFARQVATS